MITRNTRGHDLGPFTWLGRLPLASLGALTSLPGGVASRPRNAGWLAGTREGLDCRGRFTPAQGARGEPGRGTGRQAVRTGKGVRWRDHVCKTHGCLRFLRERPKMKLGASGSVS